MTDDMSRLGEPVGEPAEEGTPVDDVVVRAQEGLAEAEAAGAGAAASSAGEPASTDAADAADGDDDDAFAARYAGHLSEEPLAEASASEQAGHMHASAPEAAAVAVTASEPAAAESSAAESSALEPGAGAAPGDGMAAGAAAAAAVTQASAPAGYVTVDTVAAQQPIFVQAPLPPTPRGNRGVGALIGLVAAASFAVLYLAGFLVIGLITGEIALASIGTAAQLAVTSVGFWVATAVFYLAFLIFVAIANRARWGVYVILGLLVGVASYGGHLVGVLFQAPFWSLTASQGVALMEVEMVSPLAFVAFVAGRELTIWFGAWVAMHGRRATEYNREAMLEYERTLEAGPTLTRV